LLLNCFGERQNQRVHGANWEREVYGFSSIVYNVFCVNSGHVFYAFNVFP